MVRILFGGWTYLTRHTHLSTPTLGTSVSRHRSGCAERAESHSSIWDTRRPRVRLDPSTWLPGCQRCSGNLFKDDEDHDNDQDLRVLVVRESFLGRPLRLGEGFGGAVEWAWWGLIAPAMRTFHIWLAAKMSARRGQVGACGLRCPKPPSALLAHLPAHRDLSTFS